MSRPTTPGGHLVPRAKLVMLNIPVTDQKQGRLFYRSLLGKSMIHSHYKKENRHHAPASAGVKIDVGPPITPGQPIMAMFEVRSLKNTVKRLKKLGGKVVAQNVDIPVAPEYMADLGPDWKKLYNTDVGNSMGKATVMTDPSGNGIVLIEVQKWAAKAFADGDVRDDELNAHAVAKKVAEKTFGNSEYMNDPVDPDDDIESDED